jgi:O-antigen ligase
LVVLTLNISQIFNIEKANAVEKSFLLVAVIIMVLRGRIIVPALACAAFIAFATLISAMATNFPYFDWDIYSRSLTSLVTTLLFLVAIPKREDSEFGLILFAWLPIAQLFIGLLYQGAFGIPIFKPDPLTFSVRLAATTAPAFYAPLCAAGAFAAVFLGDFRNRLYLLLVPVNAVLLLLTAARMPMLVFVLCCGAGLALSFRGRYTLKLVVLVSATVFAGLIGAIFADQMLARFSTGTLSGREFMWRFLYQLSDQYPTFGIGLGHHAIAVPREVKLITNTIAAHNEYLRLLVETGWVGSTFMAIGAIGLFAAIWSTREIHYSRIFLVAVLAFAVYTVTDNTLARYEANAVLVVALFGCSMMSQAGAPKPQRVAARTGGRYRPPRRRLPQTASPTIKVNET